jgi:hypothetical protein
MGRAKCDHIKRLITLTSDNIKRLSLYLRAVSEIKNRLKNDSILTFSDEKLPEQKICNVTGFQTKCFFFKS